MNSYIKQKKPIYR